MNTSEIITALDEEIARLSEVRNLLSEVDDALVAPSLSAGSQQEAAPGKKKRGRPRGSGSKATSFTPAEFAPKRRTMSAEGKARIAAAQRARWAKQRGGPSATAGTGLRAKKAASKTVASAGTKSPAKRASSRKFSANAAAAKRTAPGKKAAPRKAATKAAVASAKPVSGAAPETNATA